MKNLQPFISIIVPVYNVEKWLNKCVDSILGQTHENIELILVDDGSPDRCGEICDEYAKKDARVKVIHQENARQGAARNSGLDIAKGDYIGFVDSDDYIAPDMYEEMLSKMEEHNADMAVCGYYSITPYQRVASCTNDGVLVMDNHEAMKTYYSTQLIHSTVWNKLYKRRLWGDLRFPEKVLREDEYVFYRALANAEKVVHIGEAKYYYIIREGSSEHGGFRLDFLISNETIDRQYDYIKENYPELEDTLWDKRIEARYCLIKNMVISGVDKKYKNEYDDMIEFLKSNIAKNERVKKASKRLVKYGKVVFTEIVLLNKAKAIVKKFVSSVRNFCK